MYFQSDTMKVDKTEMMQYATSIGIANPQKYTKEQLTLKIADKVGVDSKVMRNFNYGVVGKSH